MPSIALVSMPFASSRRPSLQLGLLKGLAERAGWSAGCFHFSLDFAALVGRAPYELLCRHRGMQLAEWVFSAAAFGAAAPDEDGAMLRALPGGYLAEIERHGIADPCAWLDRLRRVLAPRFVEAAAAAVEAGGFDAVGFTSTFQQNLASFALAARLKHGSRPPVTIFGGANFDDAMGLEFVRAIPALDLAVIGEGDEAFPELLGALAGGRDPAEVPGVARRGADGAVLHRPRTAPFEKLDELPVPDYAEYFERAERLGFLADDPRRKVDLPFEGARGCWWGQKHHCVFCGLNAGTMRFRAKSPGRVLAEVSELSRSHRSLYLEAVDNIIDMELLGTLAPAIERMGVSWNIFFEVKSNLTREQVGQLARAGVRRIQPGIESLSTPILRIMRKGVTAAQNVNLLRWCAQDGISVSWNMLWGFPGETEAQYAEQAALLPLLRHLQPPDGHGRLWLERFSPLFARPQEFGVRDVVPQASYRWVYPAGIDLGSAAYFFDYELEGALPEESFAPLVAGLEAWREAWRTPDARPTLRCFLGPGFLRLEDRRGLGRDGVYDLDGVLADVYGAALQRPVGLNQMERDTGHTRGAVERAAADFIAAGLMMRDGPLFLSLALPAAVA